MKTAIKTVLVLLCAFVTFIAFRDYRPPAHSMIISGTNCVAIGVNAMAPFDNSIALGKNAEARETKELVIRYVDGSEFRMILKTNVYFGW